MLWPVLRTLLTGSPLTLSLVLQSKYHKKSCVVDGGFETQKMWTVLSKVLWLGRAAVRTWTQVSPNWFSQKFKPSFYRTILQIAYRSACKSFLWLTMSFSDKLGEISDSLSAALYRGVSEYSYRYCIPHFRQSEAAVCLTLGPVRGTSVTGFLRQVFFFLCTIPVFSLLFFKYQHNTSQLLA